jgi:hypothetical protein
MISEKKDILLGILYCFYLSEGKMRIFIHNIWKTGCIKSQTKQNTSLGRKFISLSASGTLHEFWKVWNQWHVSTISLEYCQRKSKHVFKGKFTLLRTFYIFWHSACVHHLQTGVGIWTTDAISRDVINSDLEEVDLKIKKEKKFSMVKSSECRLHKI